MHRFESDRRMNRNNFEAVIDGITDLQSIRIYFSSHGPFEDHSEILVSIENFSVLIQHLLTIQNGATVTNLAILLVAPRNYFLYRYLSSLS